jgi:hypothetical protein
MGTQDSGVTAPAPYLHGLTDAQLELVARNRAAVLQTAIDTGDYEVAEVLRDPLVAVNREVERRIDVLIEQSRALRAFFEDGDQPTSARAALVRVGDEVHARVLQEVAGD